jgi:hypothetical protein
LIGRRAFQDTFLTHVALSQRLGRIEAGVFSGSLLSQVTIPCGVEVVEELAFQGCGKMERVLFQAPSRLKRIERKAFDHTSIWELTLPQSLEVVGEAAFAGTGELVLQVNDGLKAVEKEAFLGRRMKELVIPATIQIIGERAFSPDCLISFAGEASPELEAWNVERLAQQTAMFRAQS